MPKVIDVTPQHLKCSIRSPATPLPDCSVHAGPWAQGSTEENTNASTATNRIATMPVISTRRAGVAVERRAIEADTTAIPVTPATAAEMKHSVSQVDASGRAAITPRTIPRGSRLGGCETTRRMSNTPPDSAEAARFDRFFDVVWGSARAGARMCSRPGRLPARSSTALGQPRVARPKRAPPGTGAEEALRRWRAKLRLSG
jgi:hypothetical protein